MRSKLSLAIISAMGVMPAAFSAIDSTPSSKSTVAIRGHRVEIDETGEWLNRPKRRTGRLNAKTAKGIRSTMRQYGHDPREAVYVEQDHRGSVTIRLKAGCGRDEYRSAKAFHRK